MKNAFSLRRYLMLTKLTFVGTQKLLLYFGITVFVFLLLIYYLFAINSYSIYTPDEMANLQMVVLFFGLGLVMCISSSLSFALINKKAKASSYYLIPATLVEKYLANLTVYLVLPFLGYMILFYTSSALCVYLHNEIIPTIDVVKQQIIPYHPFVRATLINPFELSSNFDGFNTAPIFYTFVFAFAAIFIMGSALLRKLQFVQTVVFLAIYGFINILLLINIVGRFENINEIKFNPIFIAGGEPDKYIYIYGMEHILFYGVPLIVAGLCMYTAFTKVKNQEI